MFDVLRVVSHSLMEKMPITELFASIQLRIQNRTKCQMGVAGKHDDALNLIAAHLIVENLGIRVGFIAKLNQSMA